MLRLSRAILIIPVRSDGDAARRRAKKNAPANRSVERQREAVGSYEPFGLISVSYEPFGLISV